MTPSALLLRVEAEMSLTRAEACVLRAYAKFADNNSGKCWPSLDTVAGEARYSVATVVRATRSLIAKGLIENVRTRFNSSTVRRLCLEKLADVALSVKRVTGKMAKYVAKLLRSATSQVIENKGDDHSASTADHDAHLTVSPYHPFPSETLWRKWLCERHEGETKEKWLLRHGYRC